VAGVEQKNGHGDEHHSAGGPIGQVGLPEEQRDGDEGAEDSREGTDALSDAHNAALLGWIATAADQGLKRGGHHREASDFDG